MADVIAAIQVLASTITALPPPLVVVEPSPAPTIEMPDLDEWLAAVKQSVATAIASTPRPPTAEAIGAAVAAHQPEDHAAEKLTAVGDELRKLIKLIPALSSPIVGLSDYQLRKTPVPVAFTGSDSLTEIESNTDNRYGGGKTPVVATVTASGDTTVHTPAAGNAIRLFWVSVINDPDESATPLIKIGFGAGSSITAEKYRVFAAAHWEMFEGAADEKLIVNLSEAGSVAFTAHLTEFTP